MPKRMLKEEIPAIQVVDKEAFEIVRKYQMTYLVQESKNKLDAAQ